MMDAEALAGRLADAVSQLDVVAGWVRSPPFADHQAATEIELVSEELHSLKLTIERETFAAVSA